MMLDRLKRWIPRGRRTVVGIPLLWLCAFFIIPFALVLKVSFAEQALAQPPYTPLVQQEDGKVTVSLSTTSYKTLSDEVDAFVHKPWSEAVQESQYLVAYGNALKLAVLTTLLTLLIGYPIAYNIARADDATRNTLLMFVMIPFWTSFLLRVYAWIGILKDNGVINNVLMSLGITHEPIAMLYTPFSVLLGMVYNYLPFMILPLYANLVKLDGRLLEAAANLGCKPWPTFFQITLPLSKAGIVAGSMMVFIPAVGEYVIPSLLGGGDVVFIGNKLMEDYGVNTNWPQAAAVAVVMFILVLGPIVYLHRSEQAAREAEQ